MAKSDIKAFIENYWSKYLHDGTVERKAWRRFKEAAARTSGIPCDMETLASLFVEFTGEQPTYSYSNNLPEYRIIEYKEKCIRMADALTTEPESISDLFNVGSYGRKKGYFYRSSAPLHSDCPDSVRRCFVKMAECGLINMVEIRTCGRCHIRLFSLK